MKCPYCGTEVTSEDLYCGECGKQLPSVPGESRRSRWPLIAAILGVLIVACIACSVIWILLPDGTDTVVSDVSPTPADTPAPSESNTALPSPTEQASWSTYSSTELGLTLGYPNDWLVEEDTSLRQVVFAPQQEGLEVDEFLRTTSFAVVVNRTEEPLVDTASQALEEVGGFLADAYPEADLGEIEPVRVAGQDGALMTIEGEFSEPGARLKGWLAATVAYDHVYIFVAGAQIEEWSQREATLQAMLDSAVLSQPSPEPTAPVVTPSSTSVPSGTGVSPTTAPTTTPVQIEGADRYEPDDSIAESALITTDGVQQTHNLHVEGDHDYLFFQATAGNAYTIQTLDLGPEIDTIIYLLDGDEQEIARNDDGTEEPLASLIVWVAPSSGTYYIMVRDLAEDSSGADASYSVSVTESASVEGADLYEPDDTFSEASLIDIDGASQAHTFHTTTDVDCVWFMADEGTEYAIETLNLSGDCDTEMYLYDESGTELAYNDDAGDEDYASLIVWEAPADGLYYVAAVEFNGRAGPGLGYEIAVSLQ